MNNKYDLSIVVPAIRTHKWDKLYDSIQESCKRYSWELILISPFDLPEELKKYSNIKLVKDFGHPTRCLQLGLFEVEGRLMYHTTDDALCFPDAIDECIDFYNKNCGFKDVVNMRYREGANYSGDTMPIEYWNAWNHGPLRLPGIPHDYKLALHHMLHVDYITMLGGYDCNFQHANFSLHDLMFRVQYDGGKIYNSPMDVTTCDHYVDRTVDHAAIADSHVQWDLPYFQQLYMQPDVLKGRVEININNWADQPSVWTTRFKKGIPTKYEELLENADKK